VFPIPVPAGSNAVSVPLSVISPTMADPVARFVAAPDFHNRPEGNGLGELTVVDSGMFSWNGHDRDGASPRLTSVNGLRIQDYLRITFGGQAIGPSTDGLIISARGPSPSLVVSSGLRRLPPFSGRYYFAVSVTRLPATPGAEQITASPLPDPILEFAADRSFSRRVTFNAIPAPNPVDTYAVHVFIAPTGAFHPARPPLTRRFGLAVFP
jgi:hypothetical protein